MSSFDVHGTVDIRDDSGRFLAHCAEAAAKSAQEAAAAGAQAARFRAPRKTGAMRSTIHADTTYVNEYANRLTATTTFRVGTRHWRYQEYGTAPHLITADVRFFWEREGRMWTPGYALGFKPGTTWIHHPGNHGRHFMLFGYEVAKEELKAAVHRNYP